MAFSGPSKEELENYFKNSRQYFDELAKYYLQSDKQYYDEFIAPFYNNPFRMAGAKTSSSGSARGIVLIAVMIMLIGAGAAVFMIVSTSDNSTESDDSTDRKTEEVSKKVISTPDTSSSDQTDYYEKGMNYFFDKDFDNAERNFKKVPRSDKHYSDAIKRLKMIEEMKLRQEVNPNDRNNRVQPKKRYN